jgi:hypothetical protein
MRFAVVPFFVLTASFTLAATPTATTTAPNAAPTKIDMSKPPAPPSNVNVLNFPDVQTVGGTVNIGNLPLTEGNQVKTVPGISNRVLTLIDGEIVFHPGDHWESPEFDISQFTEFYNRLVTGDSLGTGNGGFACSLVARWTNDEAFFVVQNVQFNSMLTPTSLVGIEAKIICDMGGNPGDFVAVRLWRVLLRRT